MLRMMVTKTIHSNTENINSDIFQKILLIMEKNQIIIPETHFKPTKQL